ncbi:MAG: hypothetical protein APF80_15545 [Alphaproteobacteria bacterium BRH_c36]|nr:MAG: hypothetical protein APF80_15545 [Alphaproteobacteria bacterium BRH_c36]
MSKRPAALHSVDEAEQIALQALHFLAEDEPRLGRFLSLTGIGPAELRASAGEPHVLAAVLGHLLEDESLLLMFVSGSRIAPEHVGDAHRLLAGREALGSGDWP